MNLDEIRLIGEIIMAIGVIYVAIVYVRSVSNKANIAAQKSLNDSLNSLLEARDTKIRDLEETLRQQGEKIAYLTGTVENISSKKNDMESLIKSALVEHFANHPDVANDIIQSTNQ